MQPLQPDDPRTVGPYRLLRRIGAGGMGRVYLARSPGGRTVAVKVVHPHFSTDEQFRRRFRREVASARRVGAPHLPEQAGDATGSGGSAWSAPVLDADPDAPGPWVATGYVPGPSLQQAVTGNGPLPEHSVRMLGHGLARALCHVHGHGLVHRDVKPSNVMLTPGGPQLIDFGIARATDGTASLTSTGASIGSPGYMSPEQVLGQEAGPASDVFSLGAVLAYAATGRPPFSGDGSAVLLYKVVHEDPELDGLQGELRDIAAACLVKDPARRLSPEALAGRLAPGGADAATGGPAWEGWLPAPLLEQISRRVVELLDLEPDDGGPAPAEGTASARTAAADGGQTGDDGPPSGPVPFTTPSESPQSAPAPGTPPHAVSVPPLPSGPPSAPAWPEASEAQSAAPPVDAGTSGQRSGAERRVRRGLSVTAGAERDKRQISCSLVLTVACVLAVALLGTYFFRFFPGTGPSDHGRPPEAGDSPAHEARNEVPKDFLGTWEGELKLADGRAAGPMRVTFQQGTRGGTVGRGGPSGGQAACDAGYELQSATASTLRVTPEAPGGPAVCADGESVRFTLGGDGTLRYSSSGAEQPGAQAEATLRKAR